MHVLSRCAKQLRFSIIPQCVGVCVCVCGVGGVMNVETEAPGTPVLSTVCTCSL